MPANLRELHCEYLSASETGEYFQVVFETAQGSGDGYVLVQRQFEFPDAGECYIETDDPEYSGHSRIRNARLTSKQFQFEFGNGPAREIRVSFIVTDPDYAEAKRILQIMIPDLDVVHAARSPE